LLRPQADPRENPFVTPNKFAEAPTMTLWVNFSREDFHAWNPSFFDLALVFIGNHKFARVYASLGQFLRKRFRAVITGGEGALSGRVDPVPEISFAISHFTNVILSEAKNL
jgi:hypothetical protein